MPSLVLASTSRYRRALLERLRLPFEALAPAYEEDPHLDPDPERLVMRHAEGKATSLAKEHPGAVIIGSDQVAEIDGRILGKPGTPERAREQLALLAGREHRLLTGVVVLDGATGTLHRHLDVTRIALRTLGAAEIARYVELESPLDCAGSYKCEGLGVAIFAHQRGEDPTAVEGLPLIALTRLLRESGVDPLAGP